MSEQKIDIQRTRLQNTILDLEKKYMDILERIIRSDVFTNDLKNINNSDKLCEDIENGDYSIPVIYYLQEQAQNNKPDVNDIKNSTAIQKTQALLKHYTDIAIENISFIEDNCFKQALIELCNLHSNG